jgi:phage-related protein
VTDVSENFEFIFSVKDLASAVVDKTEQNVNDAIGGVTESIDHLRNTMLMSQESMSVGFEGMSDTLESRLMRSNVLLEKILGAMTEQLTTVHDDMEGLGDAATEGLGDAAGSADDFGGALGGITKMATGLFGKLTFVKGSLASIVKMGGAGLMFGTGFKAGMELFSKFQEIISDLLGPALKHLGGVMEAVFVPLQQAFHNLAVKLAPLLVKVLQPIVGFLTNIVQRVMEFIDAGKGMGFIETILGHMKTLWDGLQEPIGRFMGALKEIVDTVFPIFLRLINKFIGSALVPVILKLADITSILFERLSDLFLKLFVPFEPVLDQMIGLFGELAVILLDVVMPVLDPFFALLEEMLPEFTPLMKEMADMLKELLPPLMKVLGPILTILAKLIAFTMKIQMKTFLQIQKVLMAIFKVFSGGLVYWLEKLVETFDILVWVVEDVIEWLDKLWSSIFEGLGDAVDWVGEKLGEVFDFFYDLFSPNPGKIAKLFNKFWKFLKDSFTKGADFILDVLLFMPKKMIGAFSHLLNWLKDKFSRILDFFGLGDVSAATTQFFNAIKSFVMAPIETLKNFINRYVVSNLNKMLDAEFLGTSLRKLASKVFRIPIIPELAEGGIVTAPEVVATLHGPEAVVPLERDAIQRFVAEVLPREGTGFLGADSVEATLDRESKGYLGKMVSILDQILAKEAPTEGPTLSLEGL